jgi:hypothetical protein
MPDTWTYSETIDDETSTIRVLGRVDRLGIGGRLTLAWADGGPSIG